MANTGRDIRKVCADAIRQYEAAERRAKQAHDAASQQKQKALADAQQRNAQLKQQLDSVLREVTSAAQEGDSILADLKLPAGPVAPQMPPSSTNINEMVRFLQNQGTAAREALTRFKTAAQQLKVERAKWWKFW
jgi:hypothetical protein